MRRAAQGGLTGREVAGGVYDAGRLLRVLPDWHGDPASVCTLFPSQRRLPTRVRLFLDAMARRLNRAEEPSGFAQAVRPTIDT